MPIVQPNPVSLLSPTQSSAGSLKDPANQVLRKGSRAPAPLPDLCQMIAQALVSAQIQIDPIVASLRGAIPNSNLYQVLDSQGNLQVQLGDMIGPTDNKAYSGLWVLQLYIGGKGPGDPDSTVIQVGPSGVIIIPTDLEVSNLTVDNDLLVGNLASINGDLNAHDIVAANDIQAVANITAGINIHATGTVSAGGNVSSGANISASGAITSAGNISSTGGNVSAAGDLSGTTAHVAGQTNTDVLVVRDVNYTGGITFSGGIPVVGAVTGHAVHVDGDITTLTPGVFKVDSVQVVESRRTGWSVPTGTTSRATFDQSTVTLPQLAQRLAALIQDLFSHGLIGT